MQEWADSYDGGAEKDHEFHSGLVEQRLPGVADWKPWHTCMWTNIREGINTPCALDSGHRDLLDKAAAEVYNIALHTPVSVRLSQHVETYVSYTGDMGVEMGIPDFRLVGASHDRMLPDWCLRQIPPMDVDPGVQQDDVDGPLAAASDGEQGAGREGAPPQRRNEADSYLYPAPSQLQPCKMC